MLQLENSQQLEGIYSKINKSVSSVKDTLTETDNILKLLVGSAGQVVDKVSVFDSKVISTSRSLGQGVSYAKALEQNFANVAERIIKIGGNADDVIDIFKTMSTEMGRTVSFTEEALFNMALLKQVGVTDDSIKSFNKLYDTIGGTFDEAATQQMMLVNQAKSYGLNVGQFMTAVSGQLTKINQYGFPNGVKDLGEMVSRSKLLGMNIETAMGFADKIMDSPETAMDVAAQLQTLGGSFASLADPMELLYLAQNDLAGLNDKIINATRGLATFNEETGQFEISVSERMRIKQVATQFGTDANTIIETSLKLAKQEQILQNLNLQPNFKGLSEEDKVLISSYSQLSKEGGVKLEGKTISQFNSNQITDLINRLRGTEKEQLSTDKDAMDENAKRMYENSSALERTTIQQNLFSNALSLAALQSGNFRESLNSLSNVFASIIGAGGNLKSTFGDKAMSMLDEGATKFKTAADGLGELINQTKNQPSNAPRETKVDLITTTPIKITFENTLNLEKVIKDSIRSVIIETLKTKNNEIVENGYSR
jgi:hypothetical protein